MDKAENYTTTSAPADTDNAWDDAFAFAASKREANAARKRAWRLENKEAIAANVRTWRAAHPDYHRGWAAKNPDYQFEYNNSNPEVERGIRQRRLARKAENGGGEITAAQIADLRAKVGHKCAGCLTKTKDTKEGYLTIDHIRPVARGGRELISNIQFLCVSCNSSKGAKDPLDWARAKGRLL